jgi:hypothetical protein
MAINLLTRKRTARDWSCSIGASNAVHDEAMKLPKLSDNGGKLMVAGAVGFVVGGLLDKTHKGNRKVNNGLMIGGLLTAIVGYIIPRKKEA